MKFNRQQRGHKSFDSAINGVANYIQNNHKQIVPKIKDGNQYFSFQQKLMRRFLKENELPLRNNGKHYSMDFNANVIQDNWDLFKNWLKEIND